MPIDSSGAGDPARSLELLWRVPADAPRRGPQQRLSIDAVVAVAVRLADAEGLDSLTMRRVAQRLGVAPMTLYTYVPGKAELLDLMLDTAYAQMSRADTSGRHWRARLTAVAEENRMLFETHPWAAMLCTSRPPLGPGMMAKYEHELSALDGHGLDDSEMDAALNFLLNFVQAQARYTAEAHAARQHSKIDEEQWWAANAPLLERVLDRDAYPVAVRVGTAAGAAHRAAYNPEHAYEFGLGRVLDGLALLIDGRDDAIGTVPRS